MPTPSRSGTSATPSVSPPPPPANGGSCPDPRYCADYYLNPGEPSWPKDSSGHATIHYRINPNHAGVPTSLTDTQVIDAVQRGAQTWMAADPSVSFVDDGVTSDQPVNSNDVVGFSAAAGNAGANIPSTFSPDGKTITGFDIQLSPTASWSWAPCDGASVPCDPYPGSGTDIGSVLAHAWGHALGEVDFTPTRDELLTDSGGISSGPDCGAGRGQVCRFAVTLGLGDILGARHLYPTSAPMPTIYYDQ